jgi:NAD+ diphosphatase
VTPAILALVYDDHRVLLVGKPGWGQRRSIIAGFVEPGETLEECVSREVLEEAGLEVTDVTYIASQPWPYPDQLMVGFTARYAGGELHLDGNELAAGDWYTPDKLPDLPPPVSLAHHIIMQWVERQGL